MGDSHCAIFSCEDWVANLGLSGRFVSLSPWLARSASSSIIVLRAVPCLRAGADAGGWYVVAGRRVS